jgi:hypothetical protein
VAAARFLLSTDYGAPRLAHALALRATGRTLRPWEEEIALAQMASQR